MSSEFVGAPRWSNEARDRKAEAIAATLRRRCGDAIFAGDWIDVGCGSGGVAAGLARHVGSISGIDPEPWEDWQRLVDEHENLKFSVGAFDLKASPLTAEKFDVVVCNQVYEHVQSPTNLLSNIYSVLRPGGVCYFAGPNLLWPVEPHVFWPFVHWIPRGVAHRIMRSMGSRRVEEFDAYSHSSWTLQRWFRAAGFSSENVLATRVDEELSLLRAPRLRAAVRAIPQLAWGAFLPISPGFAFILKKPA